MNHVTIYRAKCLGRVTLEVLPRSYFCYQRKIVQISQFREWSYKELIRASLFNLFYKMFRGFRENHRFLIILLSIFLWMFTYSFQSFTKCFSYLIASLFGDGNKFNICLQMFRIRKGVYLLQSGMFRIYLKYLKYHDS